jgi:hypothetical protein
MRVVELSNHPGALLREIRLRPDGDDGGAARYEAALAQHRQHVRDAEQARDAARTAHRWWAWLRGIVAVRRVRRYPPEPPRATGPAADQQEILMAGIEGEQLVARGLGRVLNDEWTLIRGYRNRRGEIDHLLLGPRGLIAIEGKHRNALVHCAGDHWWFTNYLDKSGRASERGMLRASTYESIMLMDDRAAVSLLVVVAPFPMENHAVSWGWLLDGGCRGERPRSSWRGRCRRSRRWRRSRACRWARR